MGFQVARQIRDVSFARMDWKARETLKKPHPVTPAKARAQVLRGAGFPSARE